MTDRPDVEELLDEFRRWLLEARAGAEADADADDGAGGGVEGEGPADDGPPEVGLYRLVEEFTALRHEVNLQTRGARRLGEQAEALLPALERAIEQFRAVAPKEAEAAWAAGRPLAEALADLDEALDRGRLEIEKARDRLAGDAPRDLEAALDALHAGQPAFRRWLTRPYHDRARELVRRRASERPRAILDALLEGYALIQGRLRRSLAAEQVSRIDGVGRPVDPALMTVVEVVDAPGRPPGEVVDEVRRGYTWRGRVLRFAEVRASRGPSPPA